MRALRLAAVAAVATWIPVAAAPIPAHQAALDRAQRSLVRVLAVTPSDDAGRPRANVASGTVIDADGHVLTTAEAVAGCIGIRVRTPDGRDVPGNLMGLDPATGIALIRIPAGLVPPIEMAPQSSVQPGATVITVGHSYGSLPTSDAGQLTWRYDEPTRSLIQLSNSIYPGNPGGPAVDAQGRLVGVIIGELGTVHASDALAHEADNRGKSFAVPVDELIALSRDLQRFGGVQRGFLGVSIEQGLIEDPARPGEPLAVGVRISGVESGGPAARAGLVAGDLVVGIDGVPVNSPEELMRRVAAIKPGTQLQLVWVRDEERHEAPVRIDPVPDRRVLAALRARGVAAADSAAAAHLEASETDASGDEAAATPR